MVNGSKELFDITLENPALFSVIPRNFLREVFESFHSSMRTFIETTGVGIVDEFFVEVWI